MRKSFLYLFLFFLFLSSCAQDSSSKDFYYNINFKHSESSVKIQDQEALVATFENMNWVGLESFKLSTDPKNYLHIILTDKKDVFTVKLKQSDKENSLTISPKDRKEILNFLLFYYFDSENFKLLVKN